MPLLLLPPSEGKTIIGETSVVSSTHIPESACGFPVLDFSALVFPELETARAHIAKELISVSASEEAVDILKVGSRIASDVKANTHLFTSRAYESYRLYSGVLFEAARFDGSEPALIFSGLFGLTRLRDLIPFYRLSMGVSLPHLGSLATFWKRALADITLEQMREAVESTDDVVFDARSASYHVWPSPSQKRFMAPFWQLKAVNAQGKTITHRAKHYRGLFAHALSTHCAGAHAPLTHTQVPEIARTLGEISVDKDERIITLYV